MKKEAREKLIVENFAGMKHVELDIGRINLLIGPQATGKSVCAELLYLFKSFHDEMVNTLVAAGKWADLKRRMRQRFERYFPSSSWPSRSFSTTYRIGESFLSVKRSSSTDASADFCCSSDFSDLFNEVTSGLRRARPKKSRNPSTQTPLNSAIRRYEDARQQLNSLQAQRISEYFDWSQLFVPASRSFFASVYGSIFSFLSRDVGMDPFLVEFGKIYELVRDSFPGKDLRHTSPPLDLRRTLEEADRVICGVLDARYYRENDQDFFYTADGRTVGVANASSGQQASLPLATLIRFMIYPSSGLHGACVYVEEPEAHLFPRSQRSIVNLVSLAYNIHTHHRQFVITTHSPYILTSFNNLIQAGAILERADVATRRKLCKIVPKEYALSPSDFRAYELRDGGCTDLIDEDTGLVSGGTLDAVSEDLAVQFESLVDVL